MTLGVLLACAPDPTSAAPAVLLILIVIAAQRAGVVGLIWATVGASISVAVLAALQVLVLHTLGPDQTWRIPALWEMIVLAAAVVIGRLLWIQEQWWRQETARWKNESKTLHRLQSGLSTRELEVLVLLTRQNLTYAKIAGILSISPETVRTHVHHLSKKLGVAGRQTIVIVAQERGLLPPETI